MCSDPQDMVSGYIFKWTWCSGCRAYYDTASKFRFLADSSVMWISSAVFLDNMLTIWWHRVSYGFSGLLNQSVSAIGLSN